MKEQIRIEIKDDGQVHVKTIGMNDERCLPYVPIMEKLLDAKAIESEFTEEYLQAQQEVTEDIHVTDKEIIKENHRR